MGSGCGHRSEFRVPSTETAERVAREGDSAPRLCDAVLDGADVFAEAGVEGVFVRHNPMTTCIESTDPSFAGKAFRPQSSFKIAHAMIGLEVGAISGTDHLWRWDGSPQALSAWEQDLDLEGALTESCVPCFQDVARRIGTERMDSFLSRLRYGNAQTGGAIDTFWLTGPLRISPIQQVDFVRRSLTGELPIREAHVQAVWRMLRRDSDDSGQFHGKTGLGRQDERAIGWLVGYFEHAGQLWPYATFLRSLEGTDTNAEIGRMIPLREALTRTLFEQNNVAAAFPASRVENALGLVGGNYADTERRFPSSS